MRKQPVKTGIWNNEEANGWFGKISIEFVSQSYVDTPKVENTLRCLWLRLFFEGPSKEKPQ